MVLNEAATRAIEAAGIEDIVIVEYPWGPGPEDPRAIAQKTKTFLTAELAVKAVISGYRPTILAFKRGTKRRQGTGLESRTWRNNQDYPLPRKR